MRLKLLIAGLMCSFFLQSTAMAQKFEPGMELRKAVSAAAKIYKKNGITGLREFSASSYATMKKTPSLMTLERCAGIDIFSNILDSQAAKGQGFPPDPYFSIPRFQERIAPALKSVGFTTMDDANKLMAFWEQEVRSAMKNI